MNKIKFTIILLLFFVLAQASWAQPAWEDNIKPKKDSSQEIEVVEPVVVEPTVEEPKVSLPDEIEGPEVEEPKESLPDMENEED